ncbi:Glyoxylase, beta-lactamase superfamily II [Streptoalloteichus tenebrarius]|uniref:Glyoxylase, beta-lactamase superfamily II n=1 Tax=Streptoalloteichus tenebrarius (strain ATCC 17920 / DSM 40477 / JCM 4838 / CBS 697.72 / NBRC 16177 / NCIMB 11028 / NRRL B-12390 / A12253. 1 / ISP 5477) TaxID=1933 RepID=A0ABT1HLN1_STRSD|nr:MBL fold metallo-hydrolase [Streptoalloteichus tenebrarius]MCP2256417.1 Glyoxylase, beta-lactamase superfamily II [Streptoalloteichus tenebrarius]
MREVARNVFRVRGTDVNCVLVREGTELTLIDGGWVGDVPALEKAIRALGRRPEDVRAILLTHAHLDHMGALNHFHERYGVPVYMDPDEVAHARREYVEQATPLDILLRAWRPSVLAWSARISRAGALRRLAVPHARPFPDDGPLDLPGRPVPVACHGHTSGHSAYHLPGAGVVVTGDALVTGHPTSRFVGPHLLPSFFSHSTGASVAALDALGALDAGVLVPGHGDPWYGPLASAVAMALDRVTETARPAR